MGKLWPAGYIWPVKTWCPTRDPDRHENGNLNHDSSEKKGIGKRKRVQFPIHLSPILRSCSVSISTHSLCLQIHYPITTFLTWSTNSSRCTSALPSQSFHPLHTPLATNTYTHRTIAKYPLSKSTSSIFFTLPRLTLNPGHLS